ncbi:MAG: hypothetical protein WCW29_05310, partial [Candidatus Paceibacterota bacterium]
MWNYFEPKDTRWYRWELDGASVWLRKNGEEWKFAVEAIPFKSLDPGSSGPTESEETPNLPFTFAVSAGKRVGLRPSLSAVPYLVSARNEVKIMPGSEAWFAIALPPVLRFEMEGGMILHQASPFTVSNTWFGDKTAGNLCLSLPIELDPYCNGEKSFDRELRGEGNAGANGRAGDASGEASSKYLRCRSLIQCRLVVRNRSKEAVDLSRMAVFTDLMNLYEKGQGLVSDTVVITATADGSLQNS